MALLDRCLVYLALPTRFPAMLSTSLSTISNTNTPAGVVRCLAPRLGEQLLSGVHTFVRNPSPLEFRYRHHPLFRLKQFARMQAAYYQRSLNFNLRFQRPPYLHLPAGRTADKPLGLSLIVCSPAPYGKARGACIFCTFCAFAPPLVDGQGPSDGGRGRYKSHQVTHSLMDT